MDLSIVIGIGGILIGSAFALLSIKLAVDARKIPTAIYKNTLMQSKAHPEITILFGKDKKQIEALSKFRIVFFNKGKSEIRKEDIPDTGTFPTIKFIEGAKILSYDAKAVSCGENNFQVRKISSQKLTFQFDYLNYGDGGLVDIFYDPGTAKTSLPIKLEANFKGVNKPIKMIDYAKLVSGRNDLDFFILIIAMMTSTGLTFLVVSFLQLQKTNLATAIFIFMMVAGVVAFIMLARMVKKYIRDFPTFAEGIFSE